MLRVLVVILRADYVAGLSLSFGQCEIALIASLGVLMAARFGAGGVRCPLLRAVSKRPRRFGTVRIHDSFWTIATIIHPVGELLVDTFMSRTNTAAFTELSATLCRQTVNVLKQAGFYMDLVGNIDAAKT
jgi:hypothetical protein